LINFLIEVEIDLLAGSYSLKKMSIMRLKIIIKAFFIMSYRFQRKFIQKTRLPA
jgi:hypothetical protein